MSSSDNEVTLSPDEELIEQEYLKEYLRYASTQLRDRLNTISDINNLRLHSHTNYFGITHDAETFDATTVITTTVQFEAIAGTGSRPIIIYEVGGEIGFGVFDEEQTTCLAVSVGNLIYELPFDESPVVQRDQLEMMLRNLDNIIDNNVDNELRPKRS